MVPVETVGTVYDVEAWVRAVQDSRRLHAAQLSAILSTLQVVQGLGSRGLGWRAQHAAAQLWTGCAK